MHSSPEPDLTAMPRPHHLTGLPASRPAFALLLALFTWLAATAVAQSAATGTLSGRVFNPATGEFVSNAEVRVAGTDRLTYTGVGGGQ